MTKFAPFKCHILKTLSYEEKKKNNSALLGIACRRSNDSARPKNLRSHDIVGKFRFPSHRNLRFPT